MMHTELNYDSEQKGC